MPAFQTQTISIAANVNSKDNALDASTSSEPECWWARDLTIRFALFSDDGVTILNVSDLQSASLYLKDPSNLDVAPLASAATTSFDNTTTTANWQAGTNQHFQFALTADQLSVALAAQNERLLHVAVVAVTTGGQTATVCVSTLNIIDDGGNAPDSNPANAITVSQAQAMVASLAWMQAALNLTAAGATDLVNSQTWLLGRAPVSVGAGSGGAFVANLTLDPSNALTGAFLRMPIDFAASMNGTLNIYDGTTGGTLLQTITQPDATQARSFLFLAGFDGAHWHKEAGLWVT
jgi:hypothetical protein